MRVWRKGSGDPSPAARDARKRRPGRKERGATRSLARAMGRRAPAKGWDRRLERRGGEASCRLGSGPSKGKRRIAETSYGVKWVAARNQGTSIRIVRSSLAVTIALDGRWGSFRDWIPCEHKPLDFPSACCTGSPPLLFLILHASRRD